MLQDFGSFSGKCLQTSGGCDANIIVTLLFLGNANSVIVVVASDESSVNIKSNYNGNTSDVSLSISPALAVRHAITTAVVFAIAIIIP